MSFSSPPSPPPLLPLPPGLPPGLAPLLHQIEASPTASDKTLLILFCAIGFTRDPGESASSPSASERKAIVETFLTRAIEAHEAAVKADVLEFIVKTAKSDPHLTVEGGVYAVGYTEIEKLNKLIPQLRLMAEALSKESV